MSFDTSKLARFTASLSSLPRVVGIRVPEQAAPEITALGKGTFAEGKDAYGVPWKPGAKGQAITLRQTGALERGLKYVAIGRILRAALGVAYAKYQIGRRPVFPRKGAALPRPYSETLGTITKRVASAWLGGGS